MSAPVQRPTDAPILDDLWWFGVLGLAAAAIAWVAQFALGPTVGLSVTGNPVASTGAHIDTSLLLLLVLVAACALVCNFGSLFQVRRGFLRLAALDHRFRSSPTYALVEILGSMMFLAGLGIVLLTLVLAVNCAATAVPPTSTVPLSCFNLGGLLGGVALLFVGGILSLIGLIGVAVGLWRAGERYDDSLLRAGAVLTVIPFLNVFGFVVLLLGVRTTSRKLG